MPDVPSNPRSFWKRWAKKSIVDEERITAPTELELGDDKKDDKKKEEEVPSVSFFTLFRLAVRLSKQALLTTKKILYPF
jgi:hypothetical protein